MIEHRLIERMIVQIKRVLSQIEKEEKIDPVFIDITVDFIRTYADRTHHGKEDKIFFPSARMFFSEQEDQAMLNEFWEFDRKMTHEKYISMVEAFNNQ
jgi:hemerythrin-like domain-containing protein